MKKKLYADVFKGEKYIYISPTGAWVEGAWRVKGDHLEPLYPANRWVWVEEQKQKLAGERP